MILIFTFGSAYNSNEQHEGIVFNCQLQQLAQQIQLQLDSSGSPDLSGLHPSPGDRDLEVREEGL